MLKQYMQRNTKYPQNSLFIFLLVFTVFSVEALDSDKLADFILEGDNFKNLPEVVGGMTKIRYWGNVSIQQGTIKIKSDEAIIFNSDNGIEKVILTGHPVEMEQVIDSDFGKIDVKAYKIDFMIKEDLLLMTGNVIIRSKIQGEMSGEKITMNLKTKEIKGVKSENKRVKLIIKPKSKP